MKHNDTDLQYLLWMTEVAGLNPVKGVKLLEALGSAKAVWQASDAQIQRLVKLDDGEKKRLGNRSLALPNQILGRCGLLNIRLLPIYDKDYPDRLRNIYDPPLVLYIRGKLPDFNRLPAIALVGTRKTTPYGVIVTERLGFQLSRSGVIVVSGMAAGIDSAAHRGAVKGDTPTVAVFGTAIDQCYPSYNTSLLRSILYNGAAISEYPPGKKTNRGSFPRRNRIISGLSLGVVVGEAPVKSGSLITAGLALDQGRDVFAVPGSVESPYSEGCNELIARGAKLVRSAKDILEEYVGLYSFNVIDESLPPVEEAPAPKPRPRPEKPRQASVPAVGPSLDAVFAPVKAGEQDPVLAAIEGIVHLDDISKKTGLDTSLLLGKLTLLELKGKLRQLPGQYYEKT